MSGRLSAWKLPLALSLLLRVVPGERQSVRLGRVHGVTAEIHHHGTSPEEDWWYHGRISVASTRAVSGGDLDPDLVDPRNGGILKRLELGWADADVAAWILDPSYSGTPSSAAPVLTGSLRHRRALAVVRRIRWARDHAADPHKVYLYGLENASKAEERILASVDQDLIAESPMIRYTETERGFVRTRLALLLGLGIAYAFILFVMLTAYSSPASVGPQTVQQLNDQVASVALQTAVPAAIPGVGLAVWWLMARRTYVLNVHVQPLVGTILDGHVEAVALTNSTKTPAYQYLSHLLRLSGEGLEGLATAIRNFESDTIAQLGEQIAALRGQLDTGKLVAIDALNEELDLGALGRRRAPSVVAGFGLGTVILLVVLSGAAIGGLVWALMASGY